ncbi:MAG: FumA C-terminus/TtdB family hydratase beta subunit [Treponema sp.]|nr:FumA C-terminus/TtdB family hydratase beta subunit [Treponema sp.]
MNKTLNLPLNDEVIHTLQAGDIIYLCGFLVTGRDEVHRRVVEEEIAPPVDLSAMAIYHAGPIVRGEINRELVSIGPTSSVRMEKWAAGFIGKTGIKVMIGKGGMGKKTADACREFGAIHCVYPGGCAVSGANQISKIENVFWPELGMAECMWVMHTPCFGPLIVSIDSRGNNLFLENSAYYLSCKSDVCGRMLREAGQV